MSSVFKLSAFITDRWSYPHMICYWPQILKSRDGPLEKLWSGGGGRGAGGGWEKNFRAAGIFFRCRIPCINFFRPLGLIGVHEFFFFFFHSIFLARIFFCTAGGPNSLRVNKVWTAGCFFLCCLYFVLWREWQGSHNNSRPPKNCLSRCRDSHQRTQRIHSRQVAFIYLLEKEKNKWSDI